MNRRLLLIVTLAATALLGPAAALADQLMSQDAYGSHTTARERTAACRFVAGYRYAHDLYIRCRGGGEASATYSFALPRKAYGTVAYTVSRALVAGSVRTHLQVAHGRVRVHVTVEGSGHVDVRSVSISYYSH